jgi:hypothetical protein
VTRPLAPASGLTGRRVDLEAFAGAARLHPDLVGRLVVLGQLEPERDRTGRLWFPLAQLARAARARRPPGTRRSARGRSRTPTA